MRVRYKKNGSIQFYESECLVTTPHEPPEPVCGPFEQCTGCPFPGHGFICWGGDSCLRTEMARIMGRNKSVGFAG